MFGAAQRVMGAYTTYQSVSPSAASTYELLDTRPTVQEQPNAVGLGEVHGNLVFEDVAFGYSAGQMVLDGISFSIKEGETVALVGGIGSGKSTVYNLVLRFLDPQRGRILLDGHPISEVTIASLRDQVSKLAQFPFFTKDTIRENIRLARQQASDAEIEEACEHANVHSVIIDPVKMHGGYDTVVDVQVPSGGQNRTCLVISHHMDFIAAVADRILIIEHGRIAQQGDHHSLIAEGGLYKRLYEAQNVEPDPDVSGYRAVTDPVRCG
jgi:ABC-type multidrug transport system fused ATPase/permease subunit